MTVRNRDEYEAMLTALGVCIGARIPVLLWGDPGSGKTSVVESAALRGWHVETMIISHYEPSDLAGLPLLAGDRVVLAPPSWALRLAEHAGPAIAFFDELSTASPALQAAALRPLTHYQVGDIQLPESVSFVAAANPADVAAAGWELAPPTASRFVHLDWELPLDVYTDGMVTGQWPSLPVLAQPDGYADTLRQQVSLLAGFLHARTSQLSAIPDSGDDRGRAFPTPRTWDYATRLIAFGMASDVSEEVIRILVEGCVGPAAGHEYLEFCRRQDLPATEDVLTGRFDFTGIRPDQAYVVLTSLLAAVHADPTAERWTAAIDACARAAGTVGVDPAVPVVRALLRPGVRPSGATLPPSLRAFSAVLSLAGLLNRAA